MIAPRRTEIALTKSPFDYGQDLFYIRDWIEKRRNSKAGPEELKIYGALSGHGFRWLEDVFQPATPRLVQLVLEHKKSLQSSKEHAAESSTILIVSRGFAHPQPWAVRYSTINIKNPAIKNPLADLLSYPPDEFITHVMAVYHVSNAIGDPPRSN